MWDLESEAELVRPWVGVWLELVRELGPAWLQEEWALAKMVLGMEVE